MIIPSTTNYTHFTDKQLTSFLKRACRNRMLFGEVQDAVEEYEYRQGYYSSSCLGTIEFFKGAFERIECRSTS